MRTFGRQSSDVSSEHTKLKNYFTSNADCSQLTTEIENSAKHCEAHNKLTTTTTNGGYDYNNNNNNINDDYDTGEGKAPQKIHNNNSNNKKKNKRKGGKATAASTANANNKPSRIKRFLRSFGCSGWHGHARQPDQAMRAFSV